MCGWENSFRRPLMTTRLYHNNNNNNNNNNIVLNYSYSDDIDYNFSLL